MKKSYLLIAVVLLISLLGYSTVSAALFRYVKVGYYWARVIDNGTAAETSGNDMGFYYNRDEHSASVVRCMGKRYGSSDWVDEEGTLWPIKLSGAPYGSADNYENQFELPFPGGEDEDQTLRRVFRNTPPTITVEGFTYHDRFPLDYDEVDPNEIPGTAEVMVESYFRTWQGLDIHQKVLGWTQKHHDDYVIYDYTITNSGNIDRDDDIEVTGTLNDFYIMSQQETFPNPGAEWNSAIGERISDPVRIMYSYPTRRRGDATDMFGMGYSGWGPSRRLGMAPNYAGEALLHVDTAWNDQTDDPSQPQMHATSGPDDLAFKHESGRRSPDDWAMVYAVMQEGYRANAGNPQVVQYMHEAFPTWDIYPNTHHDVRLDLRGYRTLDDLADTEGWWFWHAVNNNASGPFQIPHGESIRYVWAIVVGAVRDDILGPILTIDHVLGNATWPPWEAGGENDLAEHYPTFAEYPDIAPTANDQAKDRWVTTGRDSMVANTEAAQWAVQNNYEVPIPPPAPSIEVVGLPDYIEISWGTESEAAPDFAGYRVYRAAGNPYWKLVGGATGQQLGVWEMIADIPGTGTHSYQDAAAVRGTAYYYYVTAYDDGTQNGPDAHNAAGGESLESGRFQNMTPAAAPAYLKRPPGDELADIRIVPNPFNFNTESLNFPGEPDKIMFLDLPFECTIRIYTESLDLIKTIEHYGSGDESWGGTLFEHQTTETGQRVVSGLYIAQFETPEGESIIKKFVVVR